MFDKINLYFATCKLRVVKIQDSIVDKKVVFVEIRVNFVEIQVSTNLFLQQFQHVFQQI